MDNEENKKDEKSKQKEKLNPPSFDKALKGAILKGNLNTTDSTKNDKRK